MKKIKSFDQAKRLDFIRAMPPALSSSESRKLDIRCVGAGGYIKVNGETYHVLDVNRYEEGRDKWFELVIVSLTTGQMVFLEWEEDDVVEVYLYTKNLSLRQLGLSPSKLQEMDDDPDEDCEYSVRVDGRTVYYEDSGEAVFFKGGEGSGEKYYYWDFYDENEDWCLGVERWGNEYEACLGVSVDTNQIQVLVKGGAS